MKNSIKIVCDGISNMPKWLAEKYDIEFLPLNIILDDKEFKENEVTNEEFYEMMKVANSIPKTSQPSVAEFREVFEKYINQGKQILYISGSSKSSGTYQSAVIASEDFENIHIIDSMSISFGCGMLVLEAAKMSKQGYDIETIKEKIEYLKDRVFVSMSVNSLEHLVKGGRISNKKAFVANILSIKPLLTVKDGLIYQEGQIRGKKNIIPSILNQTKKVCGTDFSDKTVVIGCGDNLKERELLKELVIKELNPKEIIEITISPCMCSHSGPGFIGLTCFK